MAERTYPEGAIHNPNNPDHFMVVQPVPRRVRIYRNGDLVADSWKALRVVEISKRAYEPCLYIPMADVTAMLQKLEKTTHCPLKGEADYHAINGEEAAWSYRTYDFARALEGHVSFWPDGLKIVEGE